MNANRRLLTPIAGTAIAGVMIAAATLGGSMSHGAAAPKSDRFAVVGDSLCAGQAWPNLTSECLAWSEGESNASPVRFVTMASHDKSSQITTLHRVAPEDAALQ
ncbi:hypothetical protein [Acuticoccus sp. I52.16.1]|uniref:hypothetical protein n=1 Tax=Acuticoccus sp. I52.16.1 TaxID=2928472 RepID=UPI001FD49A65|nr:hypothetical protein [Acuticoccus sp. I52.16.1]UOM33927.1 hypothetical protein MRB58_19130 [Acuticoccus sp. I52.16.1]